MARTGDVAGVGPGTDGRPAPDPAPPPLLPPPEAERGVRGPAGGPGPDLVVGLGARPGAAGREAAELVALALREARSSLGREPGGAGLPELGRDVLAVATVVDRAAEPAVAGTAALLGAPVRGRSAAELAAVPVPHPADRVRAALGTGSVAEAAALLVAGEGAELVVAKRTLPLPGRAARVTCAVARRAPAVPGAS